jgi:N-acetylglutamate synthase-like GNAT family acetyltransferase
MSRRDRDEHAPVTIAPTDDFEAVRALGVANGLEESDRDTSGFVAAWAARDDDTGAMVGAIAFETAASLDVVAVMAVNESHRGRGLGTLLLGELEAEARRRGVRRLYATARAPGFFLTNGFDLLGEGPEADYLLGECPACPQYGTECTPRAMTKDLT